MTEMLNGDKSTIVGDTLPELMAAIEEHEEQKLKKEPELIDSSSPTPSGSCGGDLSRKELGSGELRPGLPANDKVFKDDEIRPQTSVPSQLTMFYGGRVVVFDAISHEKASEIMRVAAAAVAATDPGDVKKIETGYPATLARSTSLQSTATLHPYSPHQPSSICNLQAELPIARKHSLQRFFEKRRDRLVSKNPYFTPDGIKKGEVSRDTGCFEKASQAA